MQQRRYDEREVSRLIQRAAELQAKSEPSPDGQSQPTLLQIQEAAGEMGIAPEHLQQAADELATGGIAGDSSLKLRRSFEVPGRVEDDHWPLIVQRIRDETGRVGTPQTIGSGFEWVSLQPDGVHIAISPNGDHSRISIQANFTSWIFLYLVLPLFTMIPVTMGFAVAWGLAGLVGAALLLAGVTGFCLTAVKGVIARRRREIDHLMQMLDAEIATASPRAALSVTQPSTTITPALDSQSAGPSL